MTSSFDLYKKAKSKITCSDECPELDHVLAFDLVSVIYGTAQLKIRHFALLFLGYKFSDVQLKKKGVFSSMGNYGKRKDYYELWNYVNNQIKPQGLIDFNKESRCVVFRLSNFLSAYKAIKWLTEDLSWKSWLFLYVKTVFFLNVWSLLQNHKEVSVKSYLAFSSIHGLEALLTSCFKLRGVSTFSLQHGLYHIYKKEVPLDAISYENFISDYHFCWGQYTKDEFNEYGIEASRMIVGGYPRSVNRGSKPDTLDLSNCVVLLARANYNGSNLRLLKMLSDNLGKELNISLKLHPTLNLAEYELLAEKYGFEIIENDYTILETLSPDKYGFSISVNTAAYYESYIYYVPSLRYKDETFELGIDIDQDVFQSSEDLLFQVQRLKGLEPVTYWVERDKSLEYVIGLGLNNYEV